VRPWSWCLRVRCHPCAGCTVMHLRSPESEQRKRGGWWMMLRGIPSAADFADCARLGMADANSELEGVPGLSSSLAMPLLLFLGSPNGPSSSIGRSGNPDSAPSNVRNSRSRSCLKCFSFCSMRLSSMYSASSSASSLGVRFSRLRRYFFRMTSRSVEYVSGEMYDIRVARLCQNESLIKAAIYWLHLLSCS
jgi:hypothetical protein